MAVKAPFPVRLTDELKAKLAVLAKHERRKPSELVRILVEDAVAAYEKEHGAIDLPASTSR